jgi:tetratricopeptide (TPR) repeat protein
LNDDGKLAEAYRHQANTLGMLGQYQEALQTYEKALGAARQAGNRRIEALTLGMTALCLARQDRMEAAAASAEAALAQARLLEDESILVRVLTNAAVFYMDNGDLARGAELLDEQIAINHRRGNRLGEAVGLSNLGYIYIQLGLCDRAIAALERSLELSASVGHRQYAAYGRLNLGLAHIYHGDPSMAQQVLGECAPSLEALQDIFGQAARQLYSGLAQELSGQPDGARECFVRARKAFAEIGVHGNAHDARAGTARSSLAQGQVEAAQRDATSVWSYLDKQGPAAMEFPVLAYLTCADVFEAAGRQRVARRAIEGGYEELMRRADRIGDASWRRSFLESVPEHRRLAETVARGEQCLTGGQ